MYELFTRNKRVEKRLREYINQRLSIIEKLRLLQLNPRKECGAHQLKGELQGKWACWLGHNIRMIYKIDDIQKIITIEEIGTHKVY